MRAILNDLTTAQLCSLKSEIEKQIATNKKNGDKKKTVEFKDTVLGKKLEGRIQNLLAELPSTTTGRERTIAMNLKLKLQVTKPSAKNLESALRNGTAWGFGLQFKVIPNVETEGLTKKEAVLIKETAKNAVLDACDEIYKLFPELTSAHDFNDKLRKLNEDISHELSLAGVASL